jgi:hypothetical protein
MYDKYRLFEKGDWIGDDQGVSNSKASGGRVLCKGGKNPPLPQGDSSIYRTTLMQVFSKQPI